MSPSLNDLASAGAQWPSPTAPFGMSGKGAGGGERIRLVAAAFYDTDRLLRALREFLDLGVSADDLWLAAERCVIKNGSALQRALIADGGGLKTFARRSVALGALPRRLTLWATGSAALASLRRRRLTGGLNFLETLLRGEIGAALENHAENGAVIIMVKTVDSSLQDRCVRLLLKHSQHTVHSQECG